MYSAAGWRDSSVQRQAAGPRRDAGNPGGLEKDEALAREEAKRAEEEAVAQEEAKRAEEEAVARGKAFLTRYDRLNRRINEKIRFRDLLKDLANRTDGDPMAGSGSGVEDTRSAAVRRLRELEGQLDRDIDHLANMRDEIWRVLDRFENPEVACILDDRFIEGYSAEKTAQRNHYCVRHVRKLTRWALMEVDRILREERPLRGYASSFPLELPEGMENPRATDAARG